VRTIGLKEIIETPVSNTYTNSRNPFVNRLPKDAKTTPCVRYAQGALSGKYDDKVFSGLVNTMVAKLDREESGVGMQNFRYAPAWDELCHTLKIQSPRAFRALREHLPARSERSFRFVTTKYMIYLLTILQE
jgi:hypothetical protein